MIAQTQRIMAIPLKRFARLLLGFLSESEMRALLQAMDNSWSGRRDHLLFLFLYNTGARVSEALSVQVQDVQRNDYRAVQLLGKGRKQRTVPLWKETAQHIRTWLKLAGLKPEQPLLPNRFGRPMTRTAVQQRLQLHVRTAQASCPSLRRRRISPHTIRHYVPFRTMSCDGEPLRISTRNFRSRRAKPPDIARHSLMPATDCSGRRGGGR